MPVELLLKARLRIGSPLEGIHRNFEFSAANAADSECRSGVKPFDDPNAALDHVSFFPNRNRACATASLRIASEDRHTHGLLTPPSWWGCAPGYVSEQTKVLA